jgi:hypothetical protein
VFTARYGLMPYINQITFRLLKVNLCLGLLFAGLVTRPVHLPTSNTTNITEKSFLKGLLSGTVSQ